MDIYSLLPYINPKYLYVPSLSSLSPPYPSPLPFPLSWSCYDLIMERPPILVAPQPPNYPFNLFLHRYHVLYWERLHVYGDVLPRGFHLAIQSGTLRCDIIEGYLIRQQRAVEHSLVPPLHPAPSFLVGLWYKATSISISSPTSSILGRRSDFRLVLIARPRKRMRYFFCARSQCVETLVSTSLHVASNIQAFFLFSLALSFGISLHRAAKITSSLVGVVGVWIGRRVIRLR